LANSIQSRLAEPPCASTRSALVHKSSYLLENINSAAVIIEVGFFSNPEEEQLLQNQDYQWDLSYAIMGGLLDYLSAK